MRVCQRRECGHAVENGKRFCGCEGCTCRSQVRKHEVALKRAAVRLLLAKGRKCPHCNRSNKPVYFRIAGRVVGVADPRTLLKLLQAADTVEGAVVYPRALLAYLRERANKALPKKRTRVREKKKK